MKTAIPSETRRRIALVIEQLRRTADTAGGVLAGQYPEDAPGYLLDALDNCRADLMRLPAAQRARAA